MLLFQAILRALKENRVFSRSQQDAFVPKFDNFDALILWLPQLFENVDTLLFDGALNAVMRKQNIKFRIQKTKSGPAGVTTYDHQSGMVILLNSKSWVNSFPAMIGGMLCSRAEVCIAQVFLHEMLHVLLFTLYIELNMSQSEIDKIPTQYDSHHNVLFTAWLTFFFEQVTIDNSLLLKTSDKTPLSFRQSVPEIEATCLDRGHSNSSFGHSLIHEKKNINVFHNGSQRSVQTVYPDGKLPHYSRVNIDGKHFVVPNGLFSC